MHRIRTAVVAGVLVAMTACGSAAAVRSQASPSASAQNTPGTALMSTSTTGEPIVDVVAAAMPSVVTIRSQVRTLGPFGQSSDGEAVGTGFVVRSDGFIVTNQHVIEGASSVVRHDGVR